MSNVGDLSLLTVAQLIVFSVEWSAKNVTITIVIWQISYCVGGDSSVTDVALCTKQLHLQNAVSFRTLQMVSLNHCQSDNSRVMASTTPRT